METGSFLGTQQPRVEWKVATSFELTTRRPVSLARARRSRNELLVREDLNKPILQNELIPIVFSSRLEQMIASNKLALNEHPNL